MIKKIISNKWFTYACVSLLINTALAFATLFFSNTWTFKGIIDSIMFSGFLTFFIGWFILIASGGLFDYTIYGLKSFWGSVFGKKQEKSYVEYHNSHKQAPASVYVPFFIVGALTIAIPWIIFYLV